jgi:hypothetical protein
MASNIAMKCAIDFHEWWFERVLGGAPKPIFIVAFALTIALEIGLLIAISSFIFFHGISLVYRILLDFPWLLFIGLSLILFLFSRKR